MIIGGTGVDTCFELAWLVLKVVAFVDSNDCETEMWLYNVYKTTLEHSSSASSSSRAECDVTASMHSLSDFYGLELSSGHFSLVSATLFRGSMPMVFINVSIRVLS
jgi:hypothetical protein